MKNILLLSLLFCAFVGKGQEARLVLPLGHGKVLNSAIFSPDGKLALTESDDKTARIYDVASGKELQVLRFKSEVNSIEFSGDGKVALVSCDDGTSRIYDVVTGKEQQVLNGHKDRVLSAVFSSDGFLVLTASMDSTARIFEVSTGKQLQVLKGHKDYVMSAAFSQDGKLALTREQSRSSIYEVATGKKLQVLSGHKGRLSSAVFSADGKLAITSSEDNTARIYEVATGKQLHVLSGHSAWLSSAVFSVDGKFALTSSADNTARIFDVATGKEKLVLRGEIKNDYDWDQLDYGFCINSAMFSLDCKLALISSADNTVRIFDVATGKELQVLSGHNLCVQTAVFSPDGKLVLTTADNKARIFDVATGKELKQLGGYSEWLKSAFFSKDDKQVLILCEDNARIYDVATGKEQQVLGHTELINSAEFSTDGKLAVVAIVDSSARIYEVATGKQLQVLSGHSDALISAVFSVDGLSVLTSSFDSTARIFDVATGKELQVLKGHKDIVMSAVFSADGKLALTSSHYDENTARIYDVSTGLELNVLNGSDAAFSLDGKLAITLDYDTARIYEVATGKQLQVLSGHSGRLSSAVFSADGKLTLTSSVDNTARIYEVATGKQLKVLSLYTERHSTVRSAPNAVFSRDGKLALTTNGDNLARIFDVANGLQLKVLNGESSFCTAVFTADQKYILTLSDDHKTIFWDAATGKQLYTRLQLKNGDWIVYDEHYRYDGSQGARDYLYFVCGLEVVDLAQVKDALYVPNLVQRIMNGENLEHLPKLEDLEICGVTPEVEPIENKKDGGYYYNIKARKGGVGKVEIYINGMLRQTVDSKTLTPKDGNFELKIDEKLIQQYQIADMETELKVIARTADNKISSRGAVARTTAKETVYRKPSLHAIMVGIDDYKGEGLDLNYAAKDAIDLQTALKISTQKLFNVDDTNRVHFYNLTLDRGGNIKGLTPDRNNILKTLEKIEKESNPEDVFVLFFAGHGEINPEKQLILLTAEASKEQAPNYSGILMKELLEKLAKIPAGKRILLLDACHSGAAINELNIKDIAGVRDGEDAEKQSQRLKELENLASKSGLSIITASSTEQKAMELPQYEHGLMTYALLTTMLNDPEVLDKDNNLQLEDWLRQTEKNVSKLIENQSAQRFVPVNFSLGKVDEEVRKSILLQEIPTIVVANVYNKELDDDNLDLKTQLIKKLNEISTRGGTDKILIAKEDGPNAISVNLSYELIEGKIKSKITLKKEKKVFKQFNFEGNSTDLNKFVEDLSKEITKNLK